MKIQFEIETDNTEQVAALQTFLAVLSVQPKRTFIVAQSGKPDHTQPAMQAHIEALDKPVKKARKRKAKADPAAEATKVEAETTLTVEDVRDALSEKVKSHMPAIRGRMAKYEAKNVTTLGKEHYADFVGFLKALK